MHPLIPSLPTLGPRAVWKKQAMLDLPYPLNHTRTRSYFMGRSAIYYGAKALGLKAGDEVLMPSYHSGTETAPLQYLGCRLKFYGVSRDLQIDLDEVEQKIGPDTRALFAIHFIGFPTPIVELREMAARHELLLIEDCAHAFLSRVAGRPMGTWGDMSIFCVYKSLPLPAGGVLAMNRDSAPLPPEPRAAGLYSELNLTAKHVIEYLELHGGPVARCLSQLAKQLGRGVVKSTQLELVTPEFMQLDPAVLDWGMGPITRWLVRYFDYDAIAARRRQNYEWLARRLRDTGLALLCEQLPDGAVPLFLPLLVPDKFETVDRLVRENVQAVPFWGTHHDHLPRGEFPDTEFLVDHVIELPIFQDLTDSQLERIAEVVVRLVRPLPQQASITPVRSRLLPPVVTTGRTCDAFCGPLIASQS